MKAIALSCAALLSGLACATPNIFIGTQGLGHVTPAATQPFGMLQPGPDTSRFADRYVGDWAHTAGYQNDEPYLWRFSQCRFMGVGCGTGGLLGLLPGLGPFRDGGPNSARMDKSSEFAEPGYYSVSLTNGIRCEVSALGHSAAYRFTFPKDARACLLVDADWGIWEFESDDASDKHSFGRRVFDGAVKLSTPSLAFAHMRQLEWNEIEAWAAVAFSLPVKSMRLLEMPAAGRGEVWEYDFGVPVDGVLELRMGMSFTSVRGAERNLAAEIPAFEFERIRAKAAGNWRDILDSFALDKDADPDVRENFEAACYRAFVHPSDIGDVGRSQYSNLSLWDIYRALSPLQSIVAPARVGAIAGSMVETWEKQGYLPILHAFGHENHCMVGHHAVPIMAMAAINKFPGLDPEKAYAAVRDSLTRQHVKVNDATWGLLKEDWDLLDKYGYYPFDRLGESGRDSYLGRKVRGESVSRLLECAYDDACAARFAAFMGRQEDAAFFRRRSANWRNVYDAGTGFMRGRDSRGRWREPFDPKSCGAGPWADNDFTEGNAWQYTWHVMHDVEGLLSAMGGKAEFGKRLDALFSESSEVYGSSFTHDVTGLVGQYAHGNEPSHHVAYLYRWSDRPRRTDEVVGEICRRMYRPQPDGLCGNDDSGQMAAWYVFSVLGFYPVDPCGGEFVIGAPQVPGAVIRLPNGKSLRIAVRGGVGKRAHVRLATFNGRPLRDWRLPRTELVSGGVLEFEMEE